MIERVEYNSLDGIREMIGRSANLVAEKSRGSKGLLVRGMAGVGLLATGLIPVAPVLADGAEVQRFKGSLSGIDDPCTATVESINVAGQVILVKKVETTPSGQENIVDNFHFVGRGEDTISGIKYIITEGSWVAEHNTGNIIDGRFRQSAQRQGSGKTTEFNGGFTIDRSTDEFSFVGVTLTCKPE